MKKIQLSLMAFLIALFAMVSFTACSSSSNEDEDDIEVTKSGIEGYWICLESVRQKVKDAYNYDPNDYTETSYFGAYWSDGILWRGGESSIYLWHFINANTVQRICFLTYQKKNNNAFYKETNTQYPFYLAEFSDRYIYTYVIANNKIVLSNGDLITLLNGKLYWDGQMKGYERVNGINIK